MAILAVNKVLLLGILKPTLDAATVTGDEFFNDGKTFLEVANADSSPISVTITGQKTLPGGISADKTIVVTNATTQWLGPFPVGIFNTDGANRVQVSYTAVTSITVGAHSVSDSEN